MTSSNTANVRLAIVLGVIAVGVLALLFLVPQTDLLVARGADRVDRPRAEAPTADALAARRELASSQSLQVAALAQADSRGLAEHVSGVVRDSKGTPVAGAECTLLAGVSTWGFAVDAALADARSTTSAADGEFRLPASAGFWRLRVRAPGFATWQRDHLVAGDVCDVTLAPATQLLVAVHDSEGRGLPGVRVGLLASFSDLRAPRFAEALSDGAGEARLEGVPPGTWYLLAEHAGFAPLVREVSIDGASTSVSLGMTLVAGVALRGTVRAEGAAPLDARVRITAYTRGQSVIVDSACDVDGAFETEPLFVPGEGVELRGSARGFAEVVRAVRVPAQGGAFELTLGDAERRVRGIVTGVTGVTETPIAGAIVWTETVPPFGRGRDALLSGLASISSRFERWRRAAITGADGSFELLRLAAGEQHVLMICAEAFAPRVLWVPRGSAAEPVDFGTIRLEHAAGLYGVARFADGSPARGAKLAASLSIVVNQSSLDAEWRPDRWWRPQVAAVDDAGRFRFDQLASGEYEIASGEHVLATLKLQAGAVSGPLELVVPPQDDARTRGLVVEGDLVDPEARAVQGAWIGAFHTPPAGGWVPLDASPVAMTFSDGRGGFKLRVPEAGRWTVKVVDVRGEFTAYEASHDLAASTERLAIRLERDTRRIEPLIGLVLGPDGLPRAGIEVALEPPENQYCGCISLVRHTDGDGQVVFEQLTDRDHRVRATDPSGELRPATYFPARAGGYFELTLER
ncbi:MAG: carboxypeptidase-like regulatory domain-containing protein [Planctomycetes bacterium]|nr:carboxypeptidase-like regulatory domain-containing protein [Planctomycetota bacterium]